MAAANPNPEIDNLWRTVMAMHRPMSTTMTIVRIQALDLINFIREREGRFDEFNQTVNCSLLEVYYDLYLLLIFFVNFGMMLVSSIS